VAEIDIDRMLEKNEQKEKQEKRRKKLKIYLIALGAAAVIGTASIFILLAVNGEPAVSYFPAKAGMKYVYNKKGGSPEEWQIMEKTENLYGYDCVVINKIDKGTYLSRQDYYVMDKEQGIARLAYSENFGRKAKSVFKFLPYRIKTGREFDAGVEKGKVVKGAILDKETVSTPLGEIEAYRVEYKALPYYDMTAWYAKHIGLIRTVNNLTSEEMGIISAGE
jgi:hypothetical protein